MLLELLSSYLVPLLQKAINSVTWCRRDYERLLCLRFLPEVSASKRRLEFRLAFVIRCLSVLSSLLFCELTLAEAPKRQRVRAQLCTNFVRGYAQLYTQESDVWRLHENKLESVFIIPKSERELTALKTTAHIELRHPAAQPNLCKRTIRAL